MMDLDRFAMPILRDSLVTFEISTSDSLIMHIDTNNDPRMLHPTATVEIASKVMDEGDWEASYEFEAGFYEVAFDVAGLASQYDNLSFQYDVKITVQPRVYRNSLDIRLLANRYNVRAAYWVNDAKPYGISDISQQIELPIRSYGGRGWNGLPYSAYMANDFSPVLLSRLYVWDFEMKENIRQAILKIRTTAIENLEAGKQYQILREFITEVVEGIEFVFEIALKFVEFNSSGQEYVVSLGGAAAFELAYALIDSFFPPAVTSTNDFILYLSTLAAALETTDPDAFETTMISVYYTASGVKVDFSSTFTHQLSSPNNLYAGDYILDCPADSVGGGKIGYITESLDEPFLASGITETEITEDLDYSSELNFNQPVFLNSFDEYEYAGFRFVAPSSGPYSVQTSVNVGLRITVMSSWRSGIVNTLDEPFERVSHSKIVEPGEYIDFYLNEGESVNILVEGANGNATSGATDLLVSSDVDFHQEHHYRVCYSAIDSTYHGLYCWCNAFKLAPHDFGGLIPGIIGGQGAVCRRCGYSNLSSLLVG